MTGASNKTAQPADPPTAQSIDPESGLKIAPGWEAVKRQCTVCHSAKLIIGQRGNRDTWLATIRWMQETQGLEEMDPKTERLILDYLATNYSPGFAGRRANLPATSLPPNPWQNKQAVESQ